LQNFRFTAKLNDILIIGCGKSNRKFSIIQVLENISFKERAEEDYDSKK